MPPASGHTERIIALESGIEDRVAQVGHKAAGLGRLLSAGHAVPRGVCVDTDAYRQHLQNPALAQSRERVQTALASRPAGECSTELAELRAAIASAPVRATLITELAAALATLTAGPLAVRSSSLAEDRAAGASAGLYHTRLGVRGLDDCLRALRECWASVWNDAAVAYRARHDVADDDAAMAVVIQELVPAEAAGVVFGADPVRGDRHTVIVEASYGLGELLVSGRVAPDRWELSRDDLSVRRVSIGDKREALLVDSDTGAAATVPVDTTRAGRAALDADTVERLGRIAVALEAELGTPQDIEWAQVDGTLHLVQTRPITTLGTRPPGADMVWSNLNSGEVLPDVMCPLTWSLLDGVIGVIQRIFARAGIDMTDCPLADRVDGRAYFNLSTLAAMLERTPFCRRLPLTRVFGGMQAAVLERLLELPDERLPPVKSGWWRIGTHLPLFLWWSLRHHPGRVQGYLDAAARHRRELDERALSELDDAELVAQVTGIFDAMFDNDSGMAFMSGGMGDFFLLEILCRRWLGDENSRLANGLLAAQGGVASTDAGLALGQLAREAAARPDVEQVIAGCTDFATAARALAEHDPGREFLAHWQEYMDGHGHHCRAEVELSNARWSERPDYVLDLVRSLLETLRTRDPVAEYEDRARQTAALTEDCRRRLGPLRRRIFSKVLKQARAGAAARENVKSEMVKHLAQVRARLLELGRRAVARGHLEQVDDVFLLERSELPALTGGTALPAELREEMAARGAAMDRHRHLTPPPVVGPPDLVLGDDHEDTEPGVLRGLAVSPGVVTGRARVIVDADGEARVQAGEILVAPYTDPGWTVHFIPAVGLVVDMGGLLSHGSIAAREFGIPAVVNVGPATTTIQDGQWLRVDGDRGEVRILDGEPAAADADSGADHGLARADAL